MSTSLHANSGAGKRKLLDRVRDAIRLKHYSLRTEQIYIDWIKRFRVKGLPRFTLLHLTRSTS